MAKPIVAIRLKNHADIARSNEIMYQFKNSPLVKEYHMIVLIDYAIPTDTHIEVLNAEKVDEQTIEEIQEYLSKPFSDERE